MVDREPKIMYRPGRNYLMGPGFVPPLTPETFNLATATEENESNPEVWAKFAESVIARAQLLQESEVYERRYQ
jgi:hypothetical protein